MEKTYTMDKEIRNNFARMLKNIAENCDLSWKEEDHNDKIVFIVTGHDNALQFVDKFFAKMNNMRLTILTDKKHTESIKNIAEKMNVQFIPGVSKGYSVIILQRSQKEKFLHKLDKKNIKNTVTADVAY